MNPPCYPTLELPWELLSACFGLLDLKDCITASHVSRTWRNTALSDRGLWNAYTVPAEPSRVDAHAGLREMLLRSNPAPFRLTCCADVPDAFVELLVRNMHRMQVLRLSNMRAGAAIRIMAQNAPLLEVFSYYWSPEPTALIPLTWSDAHAPRLRNVRLLNFLIPNDYVFSSMESFGGTLPTGYSLPQPLASIFPALTEMQLHGMTRISLELLLPLPPTLTSVTLISARSEPIDYAGFLSGCAPARLSHLRIDSATSTSIAPAVDQFMCASGSHGPWELRLGADSDMELRAEPAVSYTVFCHAHEPLASLVQTDFLPRVSTLSLFTAQYVGLCRSHAWGRTLPALRRLVLGVRVRRGTVLVDDIFDSGRDAPIQAPALGSIAIKIRGRQPRDSIMALPYVFPLVRSLVCPLLADVALLASHPGELLEADLSCLVGLARRITVGDLDGDSCVIVCTTNAIV